MDYTMALLLFETHGFRRSSPSNQASFHGLFDQRPDQREPLPVLDEPHHHGLGFGDGQWASKGVAPDDFVRDQADSIQRFDRFNPDIRCYPPTITSVAHPATVSATYISTAFRQAFAMRFHSALPNACQAAVMLRHVRDSPG